MNKFLILLKQLYIQKLRSKSFITMTFIYIGVITVVMFWSDIKAIFVNDEPIEVAIVNDTTVDIEPIFASTKDVKFSFPTDPVETLYEEVKQEKLTAVIEITELNNNLHAEIATFKPLKLNDQSTISSNIQYAGKIYGISKLNLTTAEADQILNSIAVINTKNLNETGTDGKSEDEKEAGMWTSYLAGIVIYFFIMAYLSMITTDVATEKGSRALEMLLVSVKPSTHLQSKIFGVFLLALTQIGLILAVLIAFLNFTDNGDKWSFIQGVMNELSFSYVLYVMLFLVLTIFLYLIIGALFGSLVSKPEEASQVMTPAVMIPLVGFYVMLSGIGNPDTILIKVFSYIPLTSGMVMPMRIGATDISIIEPILSILILIASVVAIYMLSLSFYKRSVLTYSSGGIIQKIKTVLKVTT